MASGSTAWTRKPADFLVPLAEFIDRQNTLTRYKIRGRCPSAGHHLPRVSRPWQDMAVLVKLHFYVASRTGPFGIVG